MYLWKMVLDPSIFKAWSKNELRNLQINMKILQIQRDDIMNFTLAQLLEITILLAMIEEYQNEVEAGCLFHL